MADTERTLKKSYLREAKSRAGDSVETQLAFLEARRQDLQVEVDTGDWQVNSSSFEGGSAAGLRSISAETRLAAVMKAMEDLEEQSGEAFHKSRPGILLPQFRGTLS